MSITEVTYEEMSRIVPLFEGWQETIIWSCLQGYMGNAFVADDKYSSAQVVVGDFCFFAGVPNEELVKHIPEREKRGIILMIPSEEKWNDVIEYAWGNHARKTLRHAIKKETNIFNKKLLGEYAKALPGKYRLEMIDETLYDQVLQEEWSKDLCAVFRDYKQYQKHGLGVAVLEEGRIVAGASSYTVYDGGIEIEIDTKEEYRRQGLATACGAKLILECLERGKYPSWDATSLRSVALAEKLGYHRDKEYDTYEVKVQ